jgi:ABC-type antimicrobial peptide transport system permease subunit
MIRSYFKIAWRNLLRNKVYSGIHIAGLAIGMTAALGIGLWIWDEISFDYFHENHRQIAQVYVTQTFGTAVYTGSTVSMPLGESLRTDYADNFRYIAMASFNDADVFSRGDKMISSFGMWVQPDFPVMMTLKMKSGVRTALKDPSTLLLSASLAKSLFGDEDPQNKTVRLDNKTNLVVGGVFEDLPRNSSFYDTKYFLPWDNPQFSSTLAMGRQDWDNHMVQLFVQLSSNTSLEQVNARIRSLTSPHINKGYKEEVLLHPMDKWHLYSNFVNGKVAGGRIQFVWLFGIIGVFVLLLACINFMNLSTARSEKRAREVGIRKAIGSMRAQLIGQFLAESVLVAFLSLILSIILTLCLLPYFNKLADKGLSIPWSNPFFWILLLGFALFTGLIAGSYPAFYLSGFSAVKVLKGTFRAGRLASLPRKVLVVVQFTISISLIIGSIIVFQQIEYAKSRPIGYSQKGLVMVEMPESDTGRFSTLRNNLLATGVVEELTESNSPVTNIYSNNGGFSWRGKDPYSMPLFRTLGVTHDFGKTIGWKIVDGRDFSRDFADSSAMIFNEAAVKLTQLTHPVGEIIKYNGQDHPIVGVIRDMVTQSPYQPMQPTVYYLSYNGSQYVTIELKPAVPIRDALSQIEPVFRQFNPGSPFTYQFVDNEYATKFSDEQQIGDLASCFSVLAIFISCLGLLGLASFVAEMRTKEISVRKVLGASNLHLWSLLSREFVQLVLIACFIAVPIAWYFLAKWLDKYDYRTTISWLVFAAAAGGSLFLTVLTISFQTIRVALANPVKNLRSE